VYSLYKFQSGYGIAAAFMSIYKQVLTQYMYTAIVPMPEIDTIIGNYRNN